MKTIILSVLASVAMFACSTSGSKGISPKDVIGDYEGVMIFEQEIDTTDTLLMKAIEQMQNINYGYNFIEGGELVNTVSYNGQTETLNLIWSVDGDTLTISNHKTPEKVKLGIKKTDKGLELSNSQIKQTLVKKNK